jgi:hypothetical protein
MRSSQQSQLALIAHEGRDGSASPRTYLTHLGVVLRAADQKASTYDLRIKIEELFEIAPSALSTEEVSPAPRWRSLTDLIGARINDVLAIEPDDAAIILSSIRQMRPGMAAVIEWLEALRDSDELGSTERDISWREQRDAANLGLRIEDVRARN